jgi:hypothetical protein
VQLGLQAHSDQQDLLEHQVNNFYCRHSVELSNGLGITGPIDDEFSRDLNLTQCRNFFT